MQMKTHSFVPWGAGGLPERFQAQPAASVKAVALDAQPAIQDHADWQMRAGLRGEVLLGLGYDFFVLEPGDPARIRPIGIPAPEADSRVLDFLLFGDEFVLLESAGGGYRVRFFALDGAERRALALETGADTGSYQQLLGSEHALFVVGNQAPAATFLRAPSLFELDTGAAPKLVHRWSDERIQKLFMDASGNIYHAKQEGRGYYWTVLDPATGQERYSRNVDDVAYPYLRLPLGVTHAGNGFGRAGLSVGHFDTDNKLLGTVAMDNVFRHGGKIHISRLEGTTVTVMVVRDSGVTPEARLEIPVETAQRFPFKNWKVIGVEPDGNFLVQGFGPQAQGRLLVYFDANGKYFAEAMADTQVIRDHGHRMQPPETWLVQPDGTLLVPSAGPDGLTLFAVIPGR